MATPSIAALSQPYGHARQTYEGARTLKDEGLLTRIPGLGYYVIGTAGAGSPRSRAIDPLSAGPPDRRLPLKRPIPLVPDPSRPPPTTLSSSASNHFLRPVPASATLSDHCHVGRGKIQAGDDRDRLLARAPGLAAPVCRIRARPADHDHPLLRHRPRHLPARRPVLRPDAAAPGGRAGQAEREAVWLPRLAPHLPLALPMQVSAGQPLDGYPFTWSVYHDGCPATTPTAPSASCPASRYRPRWLRHRDAARIDTTGSTAPAPGRARRAAGRVRRAPPPLHRNARRPDQGHRRHPLLGGITGGAALESGDVWLHGDLLPGNLLVNEGHLLSAVIDSRADSMPVIPACDLQPGWNIFAGPSAASCSCPSSAPTTTPASRGRGSTHLPGDHRPVLLGHQPRDDPGKPHTRCAQILAGT